MTRESLRQIAEDVTDESNEIDEVKQDAQNKRVIDEEIILNNDEQLRDVQEEYDGAWDTGQ